MKYKLSRTCKDCKNVDVFELTKLQAAFSHTDDIDKFWNVNCSVCGSTNCKMINKESVKIDEELLNLWGMDSNLSFATQDEDIILADVAYFDIILNSIDDDRFLDKKIDLLTSALCILLFDNIVSPEEYTSSENQQRQRIAALVVKALSKRKSSIIRAQYLISDYVKKLVFPKLNI
ncbi:hypothetical protein [Ohtaekwangia koreensis]|uniref:CpXC protein n=1 Tax=Ohtaekwangia koreensis TaxID=688867 RepID=A0A1T5LNZ6_9BACT|nr:hypothetical protein [Ohtaekwangia koreensis]SKC77672.1 hypothetical protein SAMN05660236_3622 [Ohtaekwangia koreensis]